MHTIQWTIRIGNLPLINKKCLRCGCEQYENSGCFRVNANGPRLDVWLVFRCAACKSTWNMRVYDRVDRLNLKKEEYSALLQNDEQLARRIAFDRTLLSNNHISVDYGSTVLLIQGDDLVPGEAANIALDSKYDLDLPACALIAQKLCVSKSCVRKLEEHGSLAIDGGLKKRKVGFGFCFTLHEGWLSD